MCLIKTLFPFDNAKVGRFAAQSNYFRLIMAKNTLFLTYINILCSHTNVKRVLTKCGGVSKYHPITRHRKALDYRRLSHVKDVDIYNITVGLFPIHPIMEHGIANPTKSRHEHNSLEG